MPIYVCPYIWVFFAFVHMNIFENEINKYFYFFIFWRLPRRHGPNWARCPEFGLCEIMPTNSTLPVRQYSNNTYLYIMWQSRLFSCNGRRRWRKQISRTQAFHAWLHTVAGRYVLSFCRRPVHCLWRYIDVSRGHYPIRLTKSVQEQGVGVIVVSVSSTDVFGQQRSGNTDNEINRHAPVTSLVYFVLGSHNSSGWSTAHK